MAKNIMVIAIVALIAGFVLTFQMQVLKNMGLTQSKVVDEAMVLLQLATPTQTTTTAAAEAPANNNENVRKDPTISNLGQSTLSAVPRDLQPDQQPRSDDHSNMVARTSETEHNSVKSTIDGIEWPLVKIEKAVRDRNRVMKASTEKPYLLYCSSRTFHLLSMYFPNGYHAVSYEKATTMDELPPWNATAFLLAEESSAACKNHFYYQEAEKRRKEALPLVNAAPFDNQWVGGVHWPDRSTSQMKQIKDRPMIVGFLGEVFWRRMYGPMNHVDLVVYRSKLDPRPGCLTLHDVQGVSHSYRRDGNSNYTKPEGKRLWMSRDISENPLRYDNVTNHKNFCALLTRAIFQNNYELDGLIRNVMLELINEYKPCVRPTKEECKGNDLNSYECLSGYKFVIGMDNTQLDGYMSEKIFNAKLAGGVPLYSGAPDAPNYINLKGVVWCELNQTVVHEFRKYLIRPSPRSANKQRVFTVFGNQTITEVNQTKMLQWATEYLRPHLAPYVQRVIDLDKDDNAYNAIRNEPLITDPEILEGYASKGFGLAYNFLTTTKSKVQI